MSLFTQERSYVRPPQGRASVAQALEGQPKAQIVLSLKTRPPINFNLTLKDHALQHGLTVHDIGFHYHPTGSKLSVTVGGALQNAKQFADSAVSKFGAYVSNASVHFAGQGIFKR